MRTIPTTPEILQAASHYLRDILAPSLPPADRFGALVAANAVDIAVREARLGGAADAAAIERLRALMRSEAGPQDDLETQLAEAIADGSLSIDDPALRAHLLATTHDELAIDQPGYASIKRMTAKL